MTTRICVLGLPRSGSHYVVELLCRSFQNQKVTLTDLKEPFTIEDPVTIELVDSLLHVEYKSGVKQGDNQFETVDLLVNNRIDVINNSNSNQDIILRLFPMRYLDPYINDIINCLKKNNFKFVVLERQQIEQQILSCGRAVTTQQWFGKSDRTIVEFTEQSFDAMTWLYNRIKKFPSIIDALGIEFSTIKYETCIVDIERHFNMPVVNEVSIEKQSIDNPYDLISNGNQVRVFMKNLLGVNFDLC